LLPGSAELEEKRQDVELMVAARFIVPVTDKKVLRDHALVVDQVLHDCHCTM
jgi:hypothetical protein